jgi:rare lipoprotein A
MASENLRGTRLALVAALACGCLLAALRPAVATDLDALRSRAQRVADQVTSLEHRLQALHSERARVEDEITSTTQQIAILEMEILDTRRAVARAGERFVQRAVELYKQGPAARLALVLSARDLNTMLDAAAAASNAAAQDAGALGALQDVLADQERVQREIDTHKQHLLRAEARNRDLAVDIENTLATRRATLAELNDEIARLEARARRQALAASRPDAAFAKLLGATGPAPAIPDGYVGTGVAFEGLASWYGPGFEGEATATGAIFDPDLFTAASRDLPFGTVLYVSHYGRGVVVVINDRGPYIHERILDLSRAAAQAIGISGLGWVRAEIVVPAPSAER